MSGNLPTSSAVSEIGESWMDNYFRGLRPSENIIKELSTTFCSVISSTKVQQIIGTPV